jgi:uncharacterized protein related to proFAR isomerase
MVGAIYSTIGTLITDVIMKSVAAINGNENIALADLAAILSGAISNIKLCSKAKRREKMILDERYHALEKIEKAVYGKAEF